MVQIFHGLYSSKSFTITCKFLILYTMGYWHCMILCHCRQIIKQWDIMISRLYFIHLAQVCIPIFKFHVEGEINVLSWPRYEDSIPLRQAIHHSGSIAAPGETVTIAEEMAARDALKNLMNTYDSRPSLPFEVDNLQYDKKNLSIEELQKSQIEGHS